jgi:hypothetical protein
MKSKMQLVAMSLALAVVSLVAAPRRIWKQQLAGLTQRRCAAGVPGNHRLLPVYRTSGASVRHSSLSAAVGLSVHALLYAMEVTANTAMIAEDIIEEVGHKLVERR